MKDRCPKCGSRNLSAHKTLSIDPKAKGKFDIICPRCGVIAIGGVVNNKTGNRITHNDIIDFSKGEKK